MYDTMQSNPVLCFVFDETATTEVYTLSYTTLFRSVETKGEDVAALKGAKADLEALMAVAPASPKAEVARKVLGRVDQAIAVRSEEHTSELQSQSNLVCRLLLEKKNSMTSTAVVSAH